MSKPKDLIIFATPDPPPRHPHTHSQTHQSDRAIPVHPHLSPTHRHIKVIEILRGG